MSEVAVQDNKFAPAAIEVPVGSTVTWTREGKEEHNVGGEGFESSAQSKGSSPRTFSQPGRHPYQCTFHVLMHGEVVVGK